MNRKITNEQIKQYANVSQDFSPIHFPDERNNHQPIAHGMYIMGLAQSIFLEEHPDYWIVDYEMKFIQPIIVESTITFQFTQRDLDVSVVVCGNDELYIKAEMKLQRLPD